MRLFVRKNLFPYQRTCDIHVTYNNFTPGKGANKDPRCEVATVVLPTAFQCRLIAPIKQANFKITITSSNEIPPIQNIFDDVMQFYEGSEQFLVNPNAYSFIYPNGVDCTILVAKSSNK